MPKYRVRTSQFCTLSKELKFQGWLYSISPPLHDELVGFVKNSNSCHANRQKMTEIYNKLEERHLAEPLIKFLQSTFKNCLEEVIDTPNLPPPPTSKVLDKAPDVGVFSHYAPRILRFPQQLIMENDDSKVLEREVHSFLANKVGSDYLIIGNKAYIEYFKLKYSKEAHDFPFKDREITKYRAKHGMGRFDKQVAPQI